MDVRNWPVDRIMQLPDCAFGRRFWIGVRHYSATGTQTFAFAEEAFPANFVLWAVMITCYAPGMTDAVEFAIKVGAEIMINPFVVVNYDTLLKGTGTEPSALVMYAIPNGLTYFGAIRQHGSFPGKRLTTTADGDGAHGYSCSINILISSFPTEVPDWLLSVPAGSL